LLTYQVQDLFGIVKGTEFRQKSTRGYRFAAAIAVRKALAVASLNFIVT